MPARPKADPRPVYAWRCFTCGLVLSAWAPTERHVDGEHGHGRIECLFDLKGDRHGVSETTVAREVARGR